MRFNVKYDHYRDLFDCKTFLNFHGSGVIFFHDTALIIHGNMPKFTFYFRLDFFFRKVLYVPTIRTIPYSTIVKYKKPGFFDQNHRIIYKQPNGKKSLVKFKMTSDIRKNNVVFIDRLEEYLNIANSFS